MVIVACHGAQLAFVGIFCGFARTRLEWNQDLRNQQVAIRDTMLGAEPRNLLICPHVVSDQDRKIGRSSRRCPHSGEGAARTNKVPMAPSAKPKSARSLVSHRPTALRSKGLDAASRHNGVVQKARIIAPVARATIVLIEVGFCGRALWTRPKPTTSVTQASTSITTFMCVRRLAASSDKLFMTRPPKTSLSLVATSRRKVHAPTHIKQRGAERRHPLLARQGVQSEYQKI